jgi:hypothetical protein
MYTRKSTLTLGAHEGAHFHKGTLVDENPLTETSWWMKIPLTETSWWMKIPLTETHPSTEEGNI